MINFIICDDNFNILNKLSKMLEIIFIRNDLDAKIILKETDGENAINFIQKNNVDVLITDVNLKSKISGFDVATKLRERNKNAYLIFSTAHLEYAMLAYKFKTFDYIAKPITLERLEETILRLFEDLNCTSNLKYLKIGNQNILVSEKDILYIEKEGMKLIYHTSYKDYKIYSSFEKIKENLPSNFIRCHKSFMANLKNISNIDGETIYFNTNTSCPIGPKYKNNFMEEFKKYGTF